MLQECVGESVTMETLFNSTHNMFSEVYGFYLYTLSLSDYRTRGWPLVDSPVPTILYTTVYLFIVWLGPRLMKDRPPFRLTWALVPYNLAMAFLNFYIASEVRHSLQTHVDIGAIVPRHDSPVR
uniref:Elongation of very long chain fatty acids protein n=1 Tax=Timema genevievae TaxID=629358 RepID=A0A7R9K6H5_TIMGE|nr:unnamed protein product [Timema genevievae]